METVAKLDIDGALPPDIVQSICWTLHKLDNAPELVRIDRTARGWHVTVWLQRKVSATELVAVQAILGSDPRREVFNLVRVRKLAEVPPCWVQRWNVLYSTKL